jgi:hypothetical protein
MLLLRYIHFNVDLLPHGKPRTAFHPIAMVLYRDCVYELSMSTREQNVAQKNSAVDQRHRTHVKRCLSGISANQSLAIPLSPLFSSSFTAG